MATSESALSNYTKGEVIICDGDQGSLFPDVPSNVINVKIKHGSKMENILGFAFKSFKVEQNRYMILTGSGAAIYKVISCAEIIKRKHKSLHQITKIGYLRLDEFWEPKNPELDRLKVTREIPQIHILLCKNALDSNSPGYQAPGECDPLRSTSSQKRYGKRPAYQKLVSNKECNIIFDRDLKRKAKNNNVDSADVNPKDEEI